MSSPPTLPPLPTSEALFSPKNSPNLESIGSPTLNNASSNQGNEKVNSNSVDINDDISLIGNIYETKGLIESNKKVVELYKRKGVKKSGCLVSLDYIGIYLMVILL